MTINPVLGLVDGKRQSWAQVRIVALARLFVGVTKISFSDKTIIEDKGGMGQLPVLRGEGDIRAKASISLYLYEVLAILDAVKALGGKRLSDIDPFSIVVTFLPVGASLPTVIELRNVQFTDMNIDTKTGDTSIEVPLELIVSDIKW